MKLELDKIRQVCARRKMSVNTLLREAGVSRNALYSLARKESVIPASLRAIASALNVPLSALLSETPNPAKRMLAISRQARQVAKRNPEIDMDNVRHALILLDEKPIERLRRALRRGQHIDIR